MDHLKLISDNEVHTLPDPEWLIDGIVEENTMGVLFGPPESFKSFVALDMALCIGTGKPWHGRSVKKGRSVYIYAEGVSGLKKRVLAWKKAQGIDPETFCGVHFWPAPVDLTGKHTDELYALLQAVEKQMDVTPIFVVIDTLARCFGAGHENDPKDMGMFVNRMDILRQTLGATVQAVHHTGHDFSRERGHSALKAGMHYMIKSFRAGKSKNSKIMSWKSKDASPFDEIAFEAVIDDELESLWLRELKGKDLRSALGRNERTAFRMLDGETPLTYEAWSALFMDQEQMSIATFKRVLKRLKDAEAITETKDGYVRAFGFSLGSQGA